MYFWFLSFHFKFKVYLILLSLCSQQGWLGLVDEMEMEVNRISERNLGRDDRCISDHGREARFPFLDEQVVSFLSTLPVWLKVSCILKGDPIQTRVLTAEMLKGRYLRFVRCKNDL
jgi:hypothetical protein